MRENNNDRISQLPLIRQLGAVKNLIKQLFIGKKQKTNEASNKDITKKMLICACNFLKMRSFSIIRIGFRNLQFFIKFNMFFSNVLTISTFNFNLD